MAVLRSHRHSRQLRYHLTYRYHPYKNDLTCSGGSVLQSPLIMPMLQLKQIPIEHAGTMTAYLLHNSEKFFPPLNGVCTLSNLILTITAYLNKNSSREASVKLPFFVGAFALNMATTAWAIGIMVPMNKAMARHAETLEVNSGDEKAAKELRRLQSRWQKLNYGELDMRLRNRIRK
jgi:hypothetical protein